MMENHPTLLYRLRKKKPVHQTELWEPCTKGERISDSLTQILGSWKFIFCESVLLIIWIIVNLLAWIHVWDPYPFILLNLILSFQAAFTAPIIMMSQNRQSIIDRKKADNDYNINIKAELEIELLHEKIDLLRSQEIKQLIDIIQALEKKIDNAPTQ